MLQSAFFESSRIEKFWSGAIIFTLFAVFSIIAYPGMRRRIPLSKQLLLFVLKIAKHHKSVYVIALSGTILQTIYSVYWSISVSLIHFDQTGSRVEEN